MTEMLEGPNKRGFITYISGPFNYSSLAANLADEARAAAERITDSRRNHYIDVGEELLAIKEKMAHGHFEDWCDRALSMSSRAARNYMQVARHFSDKPEIVSVLPAASVYRLAYAPEEIRNTIISWEAQQERERQAEREAAGELVEALSKHFGWAEISDLNKLWQAAGWNAVEKALSA